MYKNEFAKRAVRSELIRTNYGETIYLNTEYNSAIMGVNFATGSVIYSHERLVWIWTEKLEKEGRLVDIPDKFELFLFIVVDITAGFWEINERTDGITPTLLLDVDEEYKLIA